MSASVPHHFHWHGLWRTAVVCSFGLTLLCAAGYSLPADGQEVVSAGKLVPVTRLVVTIGTYANILTNSDLSDKERLVIRDRATWEGVWKRVVRRPNFSLDANGKFVPNPLPPPPVIDFSKEMLIVVAMGERPEARYSINVEGAKEFADRIEIDVQSASYPECVVAQVPISPIDIVRLAKTDKNVVFHETDVVKDCK